MNDNYDVLRELNSISTALIGLHKETHLVDRAFELVSRIADEPPAVRLEWMRQIWDAVSATELMLLPETERKKAVVRAYARFEEERKEIEDAIKKENDRISTQEHAEGIVGNLGRPKRAGGGASTSASFAIAGIPVYLAPSVEVFKRRQRGRGGKQTRNQFDVTISAVPCDRCKRMKLVCHRVKTPGIACVKCQDRKKGCKINGRGVKKLQSTGKINRKAPSVSEGVGSGYGSEQENGGKVRQGDQGSGEGLQRKD